MTRPLIAITLCLVAMAACGDNAPPPSSPATNAAAQSTEAPAPDLGPAPELTSYRYSTVTDITIFEPAGETRFVSTKTGAFVAPDRHRVVSSLAVNGDESPQQQLVLIGTDAYYLAGEAWEQISPDDPRAVDTATGLTSLTADLVPNDVVGLLNQFPFVMDEVAGLAARRFDLGRSDFVAITAASGQPFFQGTIDAADELVVAIWVGDASGSIIKVTLDADGPAAMLGTEASGQLAPSAKVEFSVTVELVDVNDPSIVIPEPAVG